MSKVLASISGGEVLSLELEDGGTLEPSLLLRSPGVDIEDTEAVIALLPQDAIWLIEALTDALPLVIRPE